ncbi:MAG TPA: glycerate kinase [Deltaproteobacteria bacterium]|nr:glycerate kinase [Deltaproteobacteria bacterium]
MTMRPQHDLPKIYSHAVESVDPYRLIRAGARLSGTKLSISGQGAWVEEDLGRFRRIMVLGVGKASCRMARAVEEILGDRVEGGLVVTKYAHAEPLGRLPVVESAHPVPDENSLRFGLELARLAEGSDAPTLVVVLVSGGASSLCVLPCPGIRLEDKRKTTDLLLSCGADIDEINCVRKHISMIKGGRLIRHLWPARTLSLILSDVVGDRLDTIASGITAADPTTYADAWGVLVRHGIEDKAPASVTALLRKGMEGLLPETLKENEAELSLVSNIIVGNNRAACLAAKERGDTLGYNTRIITTTLTGDAVEQGHAFAELAVDIARGASDLARPALVVAGGETTVKVRGRGKGGRNQEMALAFLVGLLKAGVSHEGISFLSGATDGTDGPTDASGAMVTPELLSRVREHGPDPGPFLENNDSHGFFDAVGGLLVTGPTGTNVCDIQLLAVV